MNINMTGLRRILRKIRKVAGYIGLTLILFIAFVWMSLPTRAIAWRISHEAKARGYIIDVEDVSISPFGGASLHNVTWTFEASRAGQIPRNFFVEEVEVDVSLVRLLFGTQRVDVEAVIEEGTITAMYQRDDAESVIKLDIDDLPLYDVPKLQQAVNAPVRGLFGLHVDLTLEKDKFTKALGTIDISCARCRVGDGESLLFIPGVKKGIMAKGITLPEIDFGDLKGRLNVEDGAAKTEGIETSSDDLKFKLLGSMNLRDPFAKSAFEFDIKVLLTEELQSASEPLRLMVQTRSKKTYLDPPEQDWMGFKLRGTVARPEFMGIKSKSREERKRARREKARARARKKAAKGKKKKKKKKTPKKKAKKPTPVQVDPRDEGDAESTARNTAELPPPPDTTQVDATAPLPDPSDTAVDTAVDAASEAEGESESAGESAAGESAAGGETAADSAAETTSGGEGESGGSGTGGSGGETGASTTGEEST